MTSNNVEPIDGLDTPALATAGLVAAIGTFALIVALQVVYLRFEAAQQQANQVSAVDVSPETLLAEQRTKINRYGWIDRENDVVAVPIDLAIKLAILELNNPSGTNDDESLLTGQPAERS